MAHEVWRDVVGYEGLYQVSNLGRIKSMPRYKKGKYGNTVLMKCRYLNVNHGKNGRKRVTLTANALERSESVDNLVAEAFIPNDDGKPVIYHMNGDQSDCRTENLVWVDYETLRDMWTDGHDNPREIMSYDGETWRDVVGYEGLYKVSDYGRMMRVDTVVRYHKGYGIKREQEMIPNMRYDGYLTIALRKYGKRKSFSVHRLVAAAFIPNPNKLPEVDHIDADRSNNMLNNLRWVTPKENTRHAIELGHAYPHRGFKDKGIHEKAMCARRRPVVRDDGKYYKSVADAALDLGCSAGNVSSQLTGLQKTVRGHTFVYA